MTVASTIMTIAMAVVTSRNHPPAQAAMKTLRQGSGKTHFTQACAHPHKKSQPCYDQTKLAESRKASGHQIDAGLRHDAFSP